MNPAHSSNDSVYSTNQLKLIAFITTTRTLLKLIGSTFPNTPLSYPPSPSARFSVLAFDAHYLTLPNNALHSLLNAKFADVHAHLNTLEARVGDRTSRILITGDLNAGKSSFVNALLRRHVVPTDQQPLTNVFTEVLDAKYNHYVEEMHAVVDPSDPTGTMDVFPLSSLTTLVADPEPYGLLKVYVREHHHPLSTTTSPVSSLQHLAPDPIDQTLVRDTDDDGSSSVLVGSVDVDVRLIDSPGLNRDVWRTMALFSQQAEIDVIVFVVSAENHFTLSSREFLLKAGQEKAYIFIVVNKFDAIRDKNRCIKAILDQIQILSPMTYALRSKLVHFVSAESMLLESRDRTGRYASNESDIAHFLQVEHALKEFTLEKRSMSKLHPAKRYLTHLLGDMDVLLDHNIHETNSQLDAMRAELDSLCPQETRLDKHRNQSLQQLDAYVQSASHSAASEAGHHFASAKLEQRLAERAAQVPWLGIRFAVQYIHAVHEALLSALERDVDLAQDNAHGSVHQAWTRINDMHQGWIAQLVSTTAISLDPEMSAPLAPLNLPSTPLSQLYPVTRLSVSTFGLLFPTLQRPGRGQWISTITHSLSHPRYALHQCWSQITQISWTWWTPISLLNRLGGVAASSSVALTGCSLVTSSILASRSISGNIMAIGLHLGMKRVLGITVLGVASVGSMAAYHWFSTLPTHIPNAMTRSLLEHVHAMHFTQALASHLSSDAKVALMHSVADARSRMDQHLVRVRRQRAGLVSQIKAGTGMCERMHETQLRTQLLRSQVDAVLIDDPFKSPGEEEDDSVLE